MNGNSAVKIIVKDMVVDVRIGLHAHEMEGGRSQRIVVNVELFTDAKAYLVEPSRETIIDYDYIHNGIKAWAGRGHTLLIETYLKELLDLCFEEKRVEAARVSISKPDIFEDAAQVGVEAYMTRGDWEKH